MEQSDVHPELAAEQAYVDRAYAYAASMVEEVRTSKAQMAYAYDVEAFDRWKRARIRSLSDDRTALVFGRIDEAAGETFYIGRHNVRDAGYTTVVVDWRAPVAVAFYQARRSDPMGLRRRRHFLCDGPEILGLSDDHLTDDGLRGDEVLQAELRRQREGTMRDIVATIQAEQDAIIRAPLERVVVVQGGPGTGKTAIGLHRAAYLLYQHRRRLQRQGVLVAGPNTVFIRYVEQVLPSLGESAMTQVPVDALAPSVTVASDDHAEAARVKGDARMAAVIARAVDDYRGEPDDVELSVHQIRFSVRASQIRAAVDGLLDRGVAYREGRDLLRGRLLEDAYRAYVSRLEAEEAGASYETVLRTVRADRGFRRAVDTAWPSLSPERVVGSLLANRARLADAADGILSRDEQASIARRRASAWTPADRPLLDEARTIIDGSPYLYGHVVADEAQDLSPMQLRMLVRRCPSLSMTVLGDLGQATGAWARSSWDELLRELPPDASAHVEELTLGYRVSGAVMELASRVLAASAPALRAPRAVRRDRGAVRVLGGGAADAVREARTLGTAALIVPDALVDAVRAAFGDVPHGEADRDGLSRPVTLVPASRCKGLEFDAVVLLEPAAVVEQGGLRLLYVALTRAMRELVVVHERELPEAMSGAA